MRTMPSAPLLILWLILWCSGLRRAMALVAKMGGKVAKKYEVDVINMVPPGTEGSGRPGLLVYEYTYLFDCHGEGAMLACRPCATVASAAHRAAAQG